MAPNSGGSPSRPIGISRSHASNAAWVVVPWSDAVRSASSSTRAVRVYPGITLFPVMPSGATSFASVRAKHEVDSLGRERLGTCASEAPTRGGDECDFSANAEIHVYFFAAAWK